jgi:hypothetical protein
MSASPEIHDPNPSFQFDRITLTTPAAIMGGAHFSKIMMDRAPLYIQTPKCSTKAGIIGSGRKMYTDLVFTNDNEDIIQWMEALETKLRQKIYDNRGRWFDSEMSEDDIEGCFSPMVKLYRSGKQYCVRVNINSKADAKPLKIYDEDEMTVEPAQITDKTLMIAILEIQGVRCTSKSFCVDLEMKQLMVLKPSDLFDSFIISKNRKPLETDMQKYLAKTDSNPNVIRDAIPNVITDVILDTNPNVIRDVIPDTIPNIILETEAATHNQSDFPEEEGPIKINEDDPIKIIDSDPSPFVNDDLGLTDAPEILEFDLDVNEIDATDTFQLRDKKEVYYEMYREALQKAKAAKAIALTEFMEARRIKNLYMLKDLNDSDDESDLEDLDDLDNDDE